VPKKAKRNLAVEALKRKIGRLVRKGRQQARRRLFVTHATRQCDHVTKKPIYIKSIDGMAIDRSEWEDERGAFFRYEETPCQFVADPGHKYCPRHELEHLAETGGAIQ